MNQRIQVTSSEGSGQDMSLGPQRRSPTATGDARRPTTAVKLRVAPEVKLALEVAAQAAGQTLSAYVTSLLMSSQASPIANDSSPVERLRLEVHSARSELVAAIKRCNRHGDLIRHLWSAVDRRDQTWSEHSRFEMRAAIADFGAAASELEVAATAIAARLLKP